MLVRASCVPTLQRRAVGAARAFGGNLDEPCPNERRIKRPPDHSPGERARQEANGRSSGDGVAVAAERRRRTRRATGRCRAAASALRSNCLFAATITQHARDTSCPSANTSASTSTVSPTVRLTGNSPASTCGWTFSIIVRKRESHYRSRSKACGEIADLLARASGIVTASSRYPAMSHYSEFEHTIASGGNVSCQRMVAAVSRVGAASRRPDCLDRCRRIAARRCSVPRARRPARHAQL